MIFSTRIAAPLLGLAALAALGLAAKPAAAQTTISFDNYSFTETETSNGYSNLGTSYSNQGFTFTSGANSNLFVDSGNGTFGDGKTSINASGPNSTIMLTSATSGQTFSLNSVDIGSLENNSSPGNYAANTLLTGTKSDGITTVTDMVTYNDQAKNFTFTNLTDLTSLTLTGQPSVDSATKTSIPAFDNFVLNAPAAPTPSAAPEPSAVAGLGMTVLGLGGLLLRARKRKAVAR